MLSFLVLMVIAFNFDYILAVPQTTDLDERIVGGIEANIEDFPYQISLQYKGRHFCGGSIISSNLVVTAAHCTDGIKKPSSLSVRAGSASHKEGGEIYNVKEILQHPEYDSRIIDYDVSIIKTEEDFKFSDVIKAVSLADKAIGPNHYAVASGWGTMREGGSVADILRQVYVPLMSDEDCRKFYGKNKITDRMLCAGYVEGGHDSCQGDSGGPLVYNNTLIGVVSWGIGCARPSYPGVYTSITKIESYFKSFF
ncbi:hypothetical protein Trydic_g21393 [Trypoxylus dichotomus]